MRKPVADVLLPDSRIDQPQARGQLSLTTSQRNCANKSLTHLSLFVAVMPKNNKLILLFQQSNGV